MRSSRLAFGFVVLLQAIPPDSCGNRCDFVERCQGNTREVCGGADQCVNRRVLEETCVAPNDACVAATDRVTLCVKAPATPCDDSFVARCEGRTRLSCSPSLLIGQPGRDPSRFVVAEDCGARRDAAGNSLICAAVASGEAQCVSPR